MQNMDTKNILIIEDEFPMRYLIEYQLKHNGYEVNLAKDGPDGLKAIQQQKPDLVLLDVMMPGMDGFEVCTQIKMNPETADIPVIFVTASEVHDYRIKAFDVGASDYLTKPFRPDELMDQITAALQHSHIMYEEDTDAEVAAAEDDKIETGLVTAVFSPKGGVGVTTLTVQLADAIALYQKRPVVMIDLALPLGGIAPMLHLFPRHDIVELLSVSREYITLSMIDQFALKYRDNMFIVAAPGRLIDPTISLEIEGMQHVVNILTKEGYDVLIDAGSQITDFTAEVLKLSEHIVVVTSGQALSNQLTDVFMKSSDQIGIDPQRILPVINELHGSVRDVPLSRVPVARIPHTGEPSDTRLWLREQGMRKLVATLH